MFRDYGRNKQNETKLKWNQNSGLLIQLDKQIFFNT